MNDIFVSVVIPVVRNGSPAGPCVQKVLKQSHEKREVIVVCEEQSQAQIPLPEQSNQVKVLKQKGRGGFAHLVNTGMRAARGTVKVLLTPECLPAGDQWLEQMLAPLEDESVGVVVSQCAIEHKKGASIGQQFSNAVWAVERTNRTGSPRKQQLVSHLCDAYRASVLAEMGYFDQDSFATPGEAADASLKIADAGYSIVLSPDAKVHYRPPDRYRRLSSVYAAGLDFGYSDAALGRTYGLERFNSRTFAAALFAVAAVPVAFASLPVAVILALAIFASGWFFLSVRVPLVPVECPVGLLNLALYVLVVLLIRDQWAPWLFGRQMHPALIRQWCIVGTVAGSYLGVVAAAAFGSAVRSAVRNRNVLFSVPIFFLALPWWLLTGIGFLRGMVAGWFRKG